MEQNKLITMTSKESNRYEIISNLINRIIDGAEAAKLLNLSVRQIKRIKAKVKSFGVKGIIHGNRGKESNRQIDKKNSQSSQGTSEGRLLRFQPSFGPRTSPRRQQYPSKQRNRQTTDDQGKTLASQKESQYQKTLLAGKKRQLRRDAAI